MTDDPKATAAEQLRSYVEEAGLTVERIATLAGHADPEEVRRILDGEVALPIRKIEAFAFALRLHPAIIADLAIPVEMPEVAELHRKFGGEFLTDNERRVVEAYRGGAPTDDVEITEPLARCIEALIRGTAMSWDHRS